MINHIDNELNTITCNLGQLETDLKHLDVILDLKKLNSNELYDLLVRSVSASTKKNLNEHVRLIKSEDLSSLKLSKPQIINEIDNSSHTDRQKEISVIKTMIETLLDEQNTSILNLSHSYESKTDFSLSAGLDEVMSENHDIKCCVISICNSVKNFSKIISSNPQNLLWISIYEESSIEECENEKVQSHVLSLPFKKISMLSKNGYKYESKDIYYIMILLKGYIQKFEPDVILLDIDLSLYFDEESFVELDEIYISKILQMLLSFTDYKMIFSPRLSFDMAKADNEHECIEFFEDITRVQKLGSLITVTIEILLRAREYCIEEEDFLLKEIIDNPYLLRSIREWSSMYKYHPRFHSVFKSGFSLSLKFKEQKLRKDTSQFMSENPNLVAGTLVQNIQNCQNQFQNSIYINIKNFILRVNLSFTNEENKKYEILQDVNTRYYVDYESKFIRIFMINAVDIASRFREYSNYILKVNSKGEIFEVKDMGELPIQKKYILADFGISYFQEKLYIVNGNLINRDKKSPLVMIFYYDIIKKNGWNSFRLNFDLGKVEFIPRPNPTVCLFSKNEIKYMVVLSDSKQYANNNSSLNKSHPRSLYVFKLDEEKDEADFITIPFDLLKENPKINFRITTGSIAYFNQKNDTLNIIGGAFLDKSCYTDFLYSWRISIKDNPSDWKIVEFKKIELKKGLSDEESRYRLDHINLISLNKNYFLERFTSTLHMIIQQNLQNSRILVIKLKENQDIVLDFHHGPKLRHNAEPAEQFYVVPGAEANLLSLYFVDKKEKEFLSKLTESLKIAKSPLDQKDYENIISELLSNPIFLDINKLQNVLYSKIFRTLMSNSGFDLIENYLSRKKHMLEYSKEFLMFRNSFYKNLVEKLEKEDISPNSSVFDKQNFLSKKILLSMLKQKTLPNPYNFDLEFEMEPNEQESLKEYLYCDSNKKASFMYKKPMIDSYDKLVKFREAVKKRLTKANRAFIQNHSSLKVEFGENNMIITLILMIEFENFSCIIDLGRISHHLYENVFIILISDDMKETNFEIWKKFNNSILYLDLNEELEKIQISNKNPQMYHYAKLQEAFSLKTPTLMVSRSISLNQNFIAIYDGYTYINNQIEFGKKIKKIDFNRKREDRYFEISIDAELKEPVRKCSFLYRNEKTYVCSTYNPSYIYEFNNKMELICLTKLEFELDKRDHEWLVTFDEEFSGIRLKYFFQDLDLDCFCHSELQIIKEIKVGTTETIY